MNYETKRIIRKVIALIVAAQFIPLFFGIGGIATDETFIEWYKYGWILLGGLLCVVAPVAIIIWVLWD